MNRLTSWLTGSPQERPAHRLADRLAAGKTAGTARASATSAPEQVWYEVTGASAARTARRRYDASGYPFR